MSTYHAGTTALFRPMAEVGKLFMATSLARRLGFSVPVIGIKTTCIMNCDQLRVIDLSARKASRVGSMLEAIMDEVLARVVTLFD